MAEENNGKEKIEVSLSKDLNERLIDYSSDQDKSVQTVVRESIEQHLDACSVKEVIKNACEKGTLREESKACSYTEERH